MKGEFLKQVKKINNIFDLMALCIRYMRENSADYNYNIFSLEEHKNLEEIFRVYLEERKLLSIYMCMENLIESLLDLLEDSLDIEICYAIVLCIDKYIEPEFFDDCIEDTLFEEYDALNEQYTDKIKILPVMQKTGINTFSQLDIGEEYDLLRKKYPVTREPLTEKIQNYIILEFEMLRKNEIKLHRLNNKKAIAQKFLDQNSVSFVVFPVSCNPLEKYFNVIFEKGGFRIEGVKEEIVEMEEKYLRMMKKCNEVPNIDFVIFPEMLMTDRIYESIHSKEHVNAFIYNGTIWKNRENVCIITDGNGNEIFSYNKKGSSANLRFFAINS